MKINTDLKLVRELTRYISPNEIEKARFKKFNAPKFDDGNLACDEFFRTEELFDRKSDIVDCGYRQYGLDDVPAVNRDSVRLCDISRLSGANSAYIESDLPYYVDIVGTNKRIYLEKYGVKNPKHITTVDYNDDFTVDEVVNIKYYALNDALRYPELEREAFILLRQGFPLEGVVNLMKESWCNTFFGKKTYHSGALTYLSQFPKQKEYMFVKNYLQNESFDRYGASVFPDLCQDFGQNHEKAFEMLSSCRVLSEGDYSFTDPDLFRLAKKIFDKFGSWNEDDSLLMRSIGELSKRKRNIDIELAYKELEKGTKSKEIIKRLNLEK